MFDVWDVLLVNSGHIRMNKIYIFLLFLLLITRGLHPLIYCQYVLLLLLLLLLLSLFIIFTIFILIIDYFYYHYYHYQYYYHNYHQSTNLFPLSLVDIWHVSPCGYPFYQFNIFHFIMFFVVNIN